MKKLLTIALSAVLAAGLLAGCGGAPSSQAPASQPAPASGSAPASQAETPVEPAKITIAYHPHITGLGAVLNAEQKGYFAEEKLEVEFVQFTSGASELAAMASGEIDLGYLGVGAHVFAPQGQCVILALDSTDVSAEVLVRADSGINSVEDLKGKTVAISAGTTSEMMVSMALQRAGIDKSEVNLVNMDNSGKVTAFIGGQVDAISTEAPFTDNVRNELGADNVKAVVASADFLPDAVFTQSWVTTKAFLEKSPDVVQRFMRAYLRGLEDRYNDLEDTTKKVAEYINTDYETAYGVVERTNWLSLADMKKLVDDGTEYEYYDIMKGMFLDAGLLDAEYDVPAADYVDLSYLKQALSDLGVQ